MTLSPGSPLIGFLNPPPRLRRSLSGPDVLAIKIAPATARFRFSSIRAYTFPPPWLLPPPTSVSTPGKNPFNTQ